MGRVKDYFGKIQIDGAPVIIMGLPKCVHQYSFSEAGGETDCSPVKPLVRLILLLYSFLFFSFLTSTTLSFYHPPRLHERWNIKFPFNLWCTKDALFPVSVFKKIIIKASPTPPSHPRSYYSDSFSYMVAWCVVCLNQRNSSWKVAGIDSGRKGWTKTLQKEMTVAKIYFFLQENKQF